MSQSEKKSLRREMRQRRRALTAAERREAARAVLSNVLSLVHLRPGLRIALYLSFDGEIDTTPIIEVAQQRGCRIYVPIVGRAGHRLRFVPLQPPLYRSRYGIPEPRFLPGKALPPCNLDVVLMPLLAFGPRGERLGAGAGFYDLTFAFLRRRGVWKKPRLIGLAYHWQASEHLAGDVWDVPMSAVATDRATFCFHRCC